MKKFGKILMISLLIGSMFATTVSATSLRDEKKKAEGFIQERTEQVIEKIDMMGIDAGKITEYSSDVLSMVFGFEDMEYYTRIKLFNKVLDRLGVDMAHQERYEVFDRIYEEGMREKKVECGRNSR